jgi:lactate dehydrogenase-like 2-hydroxyacid dehydrogenase
VSEPALIHALQTHHIAGAAIDVFEHEPAIPKSMRKLDNIVLTPHTASATVAVRDAMAVRTAENIIAALNHRPIPYRVL